MPVRNTNTVNDEKENLPCSSCSALAADCFLEIDTAWLLRKKMFLKFPTSVMRDSIAHTSCVQWPDVFPKSHHIYFIILAGWYLLFPFLSYYKLGEQAESILGKCNLHHTFYPGKHFLTNCAAMLKGGGVPQ